MHMYTLRATTITLVHALGVKNRIAGSISIFIILQFL